MFSVTFVYSFILFGNDLVLVSYTIFAVLHEPDKSITSKTL